MLYFVLLRLYERGQLTGLAEKVDVFYAAGKITLEQYQDLTEKISRG